jgi:hypothetical protein
MKYIIQPSIKIGSPDPTETEKINTVINVLTPEEVNEYRNNGFKCKERAYPMTLNRIEYEVICLEIWKKGDKEHSLVIPAFLLPHRIYPVYVYAFAINLYSSNPQLGQRKVAEETRKKYNLETFAHTTVGRAIKALAGALTEITDIDIKTTEYATQEPGQYETNADVIQSKRFPSVQDTRTIREIVKSFFYKRLKSRCEEEFKKACDFISIYWNTCFHRPLMHTAPVIGRKLSIVTQNT